MNISDIRRHSVYGHKTEHTGSGLHRSGNRQR
jgi:hypothetical protein